MTKTIKVPGKVKDKQFIPTVPRNYANALTLHEGKDVVVTIGKPVKNRSNPQNSFLFGGPYRAIEEETGMDKESIHHAMKEMFASIKTSGPMPTIEKTSKMDTVRFGKFLDDVIKWAAEFLNLYIPYPNEQELWSLLNDNQKVKK